MTWVEAPAQRQLACALVITVVAAYAAGCGDVLGASMGSGPLVQGRWVGRLRTVPVYDSAGHEYDATGLELLSGPRLPYDMAEVRDEWGGGKVPLLLNGRDVIRRKDLPNEEYAIVAGTMMLVEAAAEHTGVMRTRPEKRHPPPWSGEHVIVLRGKPEVSDQVTYRTPWGSEVTLFRTGENK